MISNVERGVVAAVTHQTGPVEFSGALMIPLLGTHRGAMWSKRAGVGVSRCCDPEGLKLGKELLLLTGADPGLGKSRRPRKLSSGTSVAHRFNRAKIANTNAAKVQYTAMVRPRTRARPNWPSQNNHVLYIAS
jgi:hypothetical protein